MYVYICMYYVQGWKKTGFFQKNPAGWGFLGFFGFFLVFLGFLGFLGFAHFNVI